MQLKNTKFYKLETSDVAILVLLDYVLQYKHYNIEKNLYKVAILVLLDYVLQYNVIFVNKGLKGSRNPCFIRLCFAMLIFKSNTYLVTSRNPCFIRLCFAMKFLEKGETLDHGVAILVLLDYVLQWEIDSDFRQILAVAILVLLDYVLQSKTVTLKRIYIKRRNPCFIRLCFAIRL